MGFTDWNQVDGISNPNKCQSALRSAKIWSVLPCCSYTAQKKALTITSTIRATITFHSADVSGTLFRVSFLAARQVVFREELLSP